MKRAHTRDAFAPTVAGVSTQLRDESPGYHHVITRGNNKRTIFEAERDRWYFCMTVDRIAKKYGWTVPRVCPDGQPLPPRRLRRRARSLGRHVRAEHRVRRLVQPGARADQPPVRQAVLESASAHRGVALQRDSVRDSEPSPRRRARTARGAYLDELRRTIGLAFAAIRLARDELLAFFGRTPESALQRFREVCDEPVPHDHVGRQPP